jgi:hypothetical protein
LLEGVSDGFVVGEDDEISGFQHVTAVFHGFVDRQEFSVVGAVLLLRRTELLGEEGMLNTLLEYGAHGCC